MGCDIHLYVEFEKDGRWQSADTWEQDEAEEGEGQPAKHVPYKLAFYHDRSYSLFAILANVRNGRVFAGVDTGDGFNPIADPRGLPTDCCPEVRALSDDWGVDGHSHSYFTVGELLAYDWTQITKHRGVVHATEFYRWNAFKDLPGHEGPDSYSGDVFGGGVKHVSNAEMVEMIDAYIKANWPELKPGRKPFWGDVVERIKADAGGPLVSVYTRVEWEKSYHRCCAGFWTECIPRLLALAKREGVGFEEVRIVFFFDN